MWWRFELHIFVNYFIVMFIVIYIALRDMIIAKKLPIIRFTKKLPILLDYTIYFRLFSFSI